MTRLVFVHGVATRSGPEYAQSVANRDALFKKVLFEDWDLAIHTPLWGDLVPEIPVEVFDTGKVASAFTLGAGSGSVTMGVGLGNSNSGGAATFGDTLTLAEFARSNPNAAIDALFVELLECFDRKKQAIPQAELDSFAEATKAISIDLAAGDAQISSGGARAKFGQAGSDQSLREALGKRADGTASYGVVSAIGNAIGTVTSRMRNIASRVAVDPLVDLVRPSVGFFLGDVFAYLNDGNLQSAIRAKILEELLGAYEAKSPNEKLVVIGHSLGGVILVDILSSPQKFGLPGDFRIDTLLTVGSQPGLFQALGLFVEPEVHEKTPRPPGVAAWFNVFDPIDPLAFRCEPVFADVKDLRFDSITGVASAHTTYFKRPQFYARARKRLLELGVIA
ncbi:MAG: hypothetical protein ACKO1N_02815 [Erythrobacter sp.]